MRQLIAPILREQEPVVLVSLPRADAEDIASIMIARHRRESAEGSPDTELIVQIQRLLASKTSWMIYRKSGRGHGSTGEGSPPSYRHREQRA